MRVSALPLLLLAVCAARGPSTPAADARPLRARDVLLAERLMDTTPWRATVVAVGRYELVPGRQTFAPEPPPAPFDVVVVSDGGEVVRVADEVDGVRMVVGVPREDLGARLLDRTRLADGPDRAGATEPTFVELAGGAAVTTGEQVLDAVHVRRTGDGVTAQGWVPRAAFGVIWRSAPFGPPDDGVPVSLVPWEPGEVPRVPLHARPEFASPVLAELAPAEGLGVHAVGSSEGGWQRVDARTTAARAVGWAPPRAVAPVEPARAEPPMPLVGPRGDGELVLAAGTWIRAEGAAEPFARATRDTIVARGQDRGASVRVRLRSRWGTLYAEADCPVRTEEGGTLRCAPRAGEP